MARDRLARPYGPPITSPGPPKSSADLEVLERIQSRVLWLAVRMVDYANRERSTDAQIKVGGHQASSASMVSLVTALWFAVLGPRDRVAVKPHASPVFHATQYLLGNLERDYLTRLREFGGLQAYPSRTKDPDPVDFSTGSVGLGVVAPLFGAAVERYVDAHFATRGDQRRGRYFALLGDAELDEGSIWEAVVDPVTQGLGNVTWVVDLNRQSLDRVVPGIKAARLMEMFAANGWHVIAAKYGRRLQDQFARPGGEALRAHIDAMSNEEYQSLFAHRGAALRTRFLAGGDTAVRDALADVDDDDLAGVVLNLGGHDLGVLLDAFAEAEAETETPSVIFAYTIKGWGLPMAGDPLNHAALLSGDQIDDQRADLGLTAETEFDRFAPDTPEGRWCDKVAERLSRPAPAAPSARPEIPEQVGLAPRSPTSTQEVFGRLLVGLADDAEVNRRLVTTSPDVAVSTNLGGWVNKVGVFAPSEAPDYYDEGRLLRWVESPAGQHLELGISEINLFMLLGQLGLAHELTGETLLPVGTVYDPFVLRGLDAFVYSVYSGAKFIVAGTPSGITLSYEGGAHQSTITASVGLELPGVTFAEPTYARALDWLLCDGLDRLGDREEGSSTYLRLTTRPVDQGPFDRALDRRGPDAVRQDVLAGGHRLVEGAEVAPPGAPVVQLMASGAVMPETLAAAEMLGDEEVAANVIDVTSLDLLHRGWSAARRSEIRRAATGPDNFHLAQLLPGSERSAPIVTVHDAAPHAMAWLGSVFGAPVAAMGVSDFGQSGSIHDLYRVHDLEAGAITNAALALLARST